MFKQLRSAILALTLLAPLALSACSNDPGSPTTPLIVTGLFNLTGDMAPYDSPVEQGVRLAVKQQNAAGGIHGRQIQYATQDTATEPAKISATTSDAIAKGAIALIGYDDPDSVLSAAPLAQRAGIPFITPGATLPTLPQQVGDMLFLACYGDNVQAAAAAEFMYDKLNARRVYLLTNKGTEYTKGLARYFQTRWNALVPAGLVLSDTYQVKDTDFSTQIAQLKTVQPPPDAFYIAAYPDELPQLLPALRSAGFPQPIVGGDAYDGAPILTLGGQPMSNIYYTTHGALPAPDSGPLHDFVAAYTKEYGKAPDTIYPALGYDAARLLFDAIGRAPDTSGPAIRTALEAIKGFAAATGPISYGPAPTGHVPDKSVTVMEIHDGQPRLATVTHPKSVPAP
ncbi:MAG TPA: ABC transporter substrate-binding protein [Chloroflexia bacterium]|nr:ABC transporter substrate-binding protein [Chloroflexia bacterium]